MSAIANAFQEFSTHQASLEKVLHQLFRGETNARKDASIINPVTGKYLEIDMYIPKYGLCFEFQDSYHYTTTWYSHLPLETVKQKDTKKDIIRRRCETMIFVPCWWDGSCESLAKFILFHRPEIKFGLPDVDLISLNPPKQYFEDRGIPDIGELMLASFPTTHINSTISILNPWWVGEKYDGVRVCWNGRLQTLFTRNGGNFELPEPFIEQLGDSYMDGEVWFGKGQFVESVKTLHAFDDKIYWPHLKLIIFDDPSPANENFEFEYRYELMLSSFKFTHPFLVPAARLKCEYKKTMKKLITHVLNDGGEGIVLRKPASLYLHGRSDSLLKLKASRADEEALVVFVSDDYEYYRLQIPSGKVFSIRSSSMNLPPSALPLEKGQIVSFFYDNVSQKGIPVSPQVYRVREDTDWNQILMRYKSLGTATSQWLNKSSKIDLSNVPLQLGATYVLRKMRDIIEKFSRISKFDPLVASNWYKVSRVAIEQAIPGSKSFLANYKGGFVQALLDLLPNIGLDKKKLLQRHYWDDKNNRRNFFQNYAQIKGFNPEVADNWYRVSPYEIRVLRSGGPVLKYYNGSLQHALQDVFPNIGLDMDKFTSPDSYWASPKNRKQFFLDLAKEMKFDPLVKENWYSIPIMRNEPILSFYGGNYVNALMTLFPDLQLNRSKFIFLPGNYWNEETNRRKFFERVAKGKGLDPCLPSTWYSLSPRDFKISKQWRSVMRYYKGNTSKAILSLFSELDLDPAKMPHSAQNFWKDESNCRRYFDKIAQEHGIDLQNDKDGWYSIDPASIYKHKHIKNILKNYNKDLLVALRSVYPDIIFDPAKFVDSESYWKVPENRRRVLEQFAKEKRFDPLSPQHWYTISTSDIKNFKNIKRILPYHEGNWQKALLSLLPDIGLDNSKFSILPQKHWLDMNNRRSFFISYANANGFDPLIPENWYQFTTADVKKIQNEGSILAYYKNSLSAALIHLFPDIKWDLTKFNIVPHGFWKSEANRKSFLKNFAKSQKLKSWYHISLAKFLKLKHAELILKYHDGSLVKAIEELFPEENIDLKKFSPRALNTKERTNVA